MDIGSRSAYPASEVTNFAPRSFVFDGVKCSSMEGLLQAFKYDDPRIQVEVCKLIGFSAKRRGQEQSGAWKRVQKLWWNGVAYDRHGKQYQELLDRAFDALAENQSFREALLATGDAVLTHSIGTQNPSDTVLTEREFCERLTRIRSRLQGGT
ncbi:MAG: hypothetical protein HY455_03200 [Parcubacteria group bacterium]|nr:hypothetical protein [Parcubacteria group bacterium]